MLNVKKSLPNTTTNIHSQALRDWLKAHENDSGGPHPKQIGAFDWFEKKGWKLKWPLHYAAMTGDVPAIAQLAESGADVNAKMNDWFDSTPLGWASSFGQARALVKLLHYGADPFAPPNLAGYTPLQDAEREGHLSVILLIEEYKNLDKTLISMTDPLKILSGENSVVEIVKVDPLCPLSNRMVTWLRNQENNAGKPRQDQLSKGIQWMENMKLKDKWPLHFAAMSGDVNAIETLLKMGISATTQMTELKNAEPIGFAAAFGQISSLVALILAGADPLKRHNSEGSTPMMSARREGHVHVVKFLEEYEIKLHTDKISKNEDMVPAQENESVDGLENSLTLAEWLKSQEEAMGGPRDDQQASIEWFRSKGWISRWPLHYAAVTGNVDSIHTLTRGGLDPNSKMSDWFGIVPAACAASYGQTKALVALIQCGANVFCDPDLSGSTPLQRACREKHWKIIRFLEEYEARLQRDKHEKLGMKSEPDAVLAAMRSSDMMAWLDTYKPQFPSIPNERVFTFAFSLFEKNGWTEEWPLHYATLVGDLARIEQLIQAGADPNEKLTQWFHSVPVAWAASIDRLDALIALIKGGANPLCGPNLAGYTPLEDARREHHRTIVSFLNEYEARLNEILLKEKSIECVSQTFFS